MQSAMANEPRSQQEEHPHPQLLVPIDPARGQLGYIGRTTLYELVKQGELVKVNIGRRGFITAESIRAYVDKLKASGA